MNSYGTGDSPHDCKLNRFERNRYFHGKLMTARDMEAEQKYHADRLDTVTRYVTGDGIVCGLEATVEQDEKTGEFTVIVQPGLALDCCGRQIIVENETPVNLNRPTNDPIHLYLTYDECVKETVPVPGSESACEEECEYNRVLEIFDVVYGNQPDEEGIRDIEFPDSDDLSDSNDFDALLTMARSYYETEEGNALRSCEDCEKPKVFLGTHEESSDDEWSRVTDVQRQFVYTNDMLYATIARHVTDFKNPHEVGLAVGPTADDDTDGDSSAVVGIQEPDGPAGAIGFTSADGSVTIEPNPGTETVDFTAQAGGQFQEYYVLEKSLWTTLDAVRGLIMRRRFSETPESLFQILLQIYIRSMYALNDGVHESRDTYVDFFTKDQPSVPSQLPIDFENKTIPKLEQELYDFLTADVADLSLSPYLQLYDAAVNELNTSLDSSAPTAQKALEVGVAQDRVAEAMRHLRAPTPVEKGEPPAEDVEPPVEDEIPVGDVVFPVEDVIRGSRRRRGPLGYGDTDPISFEPTPNVVGRSADDAIEQLRKRGWSYTLEPEPIEDPLAAHDTAVNEVIEQTPAPGELGNRDLGLTLTVNEPPSVEGIDGIGQKRSDALAEVGYGTIGELAVADPGIIAEIANVSDSIAHEWQETAGRRADAYELTREGGIGTEQAEALVEVANIRTREDLQDASPDAILSEVETGTVDQKHADVLTDMDWDAIMTNVTDR